MTYHQLSVFFKYYFSECLPAGNGSHHYNDDDSDDNEIKSIPFKKQCEEVKTIKIVSDGSPVPVSQRVLCNICNESLMSQAYLDRHMKVLHSANSLVCNDCGVVKIVFKDEYSTAFEVLLQRKSIVCCKF